jgi:putative transcriptional regulator
MAKRDILGDSAPDLEARDCERQGKVTRRSHKAQCAELPDLTAKELVDIRQGLKMSRAVFAMCLRTNARTLEGWEQGRARPNAQATALIRLVQKHPETVAHLAALS